MTMYYYNIPHNKGYFDSAKIYRQWANFGRPDIKHSQIKKYMEKIVPPECRHAVIFMQRGNVFGWKYDPANFIEGLDVKTS